MKSRSHLLLTLCLVGCSSSAPKSTASRGLASVRVAYTCINSSVSTAIAQLKIEQTESDAGIAGNLFFDYRDTSKNYIYDILWKFGDNAYTSANHRTVTAGSPDSQGGFAVTINGNSATDDAAGVYLCKSFQPAQAGSPRLLAPPSVNVPMPTIYQPGDVFSDEKSGFKITVVSVGPSSMPAGQGADVRLAVTGPAGMQPHSTYDFLLNLTPENYTSAAYVNHSEVYSGAEATKGKALQLKFCQHFPDPQCKSRFVQTLDNEAMQTCSPTLEEQFIFNPTPEGLNFNMSVQGKFHSPNDGRCKSQMPFLDLRSTTMQFVREGGIRIAVRTVHCVSTYPRGFEANLKINIGGSKIHFSGETQEGDGFIGSFKCDGHFVSIPNENQVTHFSFHETAACTAFSASLSKDFLTTGQGHISIQRDSVDNAYVAHNTGINERGYDCSP